MAHSNAASWDPAVTHFVSVSCVSNYANGVLSARLGSAFFLDSLWQRNSSERPTTVTGANWGWNSLLVDSLLQHVVVGGFGFVFQFLVLFYLKKYPVSSWHSVAYIYDLTDPLFGNNESADWVVTLFFYFLKMTKMILTWTCEKSKFFFIGNR